MSATLRAVAKRLAETRLAPPSRPGATTTHAATSGASTPGDRSTRGGNASGALRRTPSAPHLSGLRRAPTPPPAAAPVADAVSASLANSDLVDYIATSPILAACGLDKPTVTAAAPEWARLGALLALRLGLTKGGSPAAPPPAPPATLPPAAASRIYRYYLPIYFWMKGQVEAHGKGGKNGPLVLGINAPQGCGKTTLVSELEALAAATGIAAASVSIDDFYLTRAGQAALAEENKGNPLLELRGNAGSHDLGLGAATLAALSSAGPGDEVALPRYDKAAHGGLGDRAAQEAWPRVSGPLDLVLLEGWMLGFSPVGADAAAAASPHLPAVDAALTAYKAAWDAAVHAWLVIQAPSAECVYGWRAEAEIALRAAGRGGMSDEQVKDFCDRYMPAYAAYGPGLVASGPSTAVEGKLLVVKVREDRSLAE